jgi:replicative DNA helicase
MHPGQMIVLAAYTGRGKTSMALQIATHATRQAKSPIVWTMEMEPRSLFRRIVNQMARLDNDRSRQWSMGQEDRERAQDAVYWIHDHPVWFDNRSRTVPAFMGAVRQAQAKSDVGLVVVDYLQLIRFAGRAESRTREVGENSRSLKLAALELGVPFLVLSQFKRPQQDRPATIHDLKESGDIENDADVILLLNSGDLSGDRQTPTTVVVGKQREGPAGMEIPLIFDPPSQSFFSSEEN